VPLGANAYAARVLTVVTTAKITAIPNATEKAAKTNRGTILSAPYSNNDLRIILPAF
jgi:hypothetical protein